MGFKPSSKLPAVVVSVHSQLKASKGSAPAHPQQPHKCLCPVLNHAGFNWCESGGLILLGPATTIQQDPTPLFSGSARLRMDIDDWVEPLTNLNSQTANKKHLEK